MALPLEFRIKGKLAFDEFRNRAKVFYSEHLVLKVVGGKEGKAFAFAIPKRIGIAVQRNRIRRILSEWIRQNIGMFPEDKHYLIIVRQPAPKEEALFEDIKHLIEGLAR